MKGPPARKQMPRIVVVDDDEGVRRELSALLEALGFSVIGVGRDGHEAVALAERLVPDVILLDLRMPDVDGIEAARRISALGIRTKSVILSAYDDHALREEAHDIGVHSYLVKGCSAYMIRDVLLAASVFDTPEP